MQLEYDVHGNLDRFHVLVVISVISPDAAEHSVNESF
jgi:hypothetical protein